MNRSSTKIKSSLGIDTTIKDNRSLIWKRLSVDFGENSSQLRGYGLNNLISDRRSIDNITSFSDYDLEFSSPIFY